MSGRLLRKVLREQELKHDSACLDHDAEEDAESPPASAAPSMNPFDLLDDEQEVEDDAEVGVIMSDEIKKEEPLTGSSSHETSTTKQKSKKKKKKNKDKISARDDSENVVASIMKELSIDSNTLSKQDILNSKTVSGVYDQTKRTSKSSVLNVDPKFLKAENELRKIFGSKVVSSFENHHTVTSSRNLRGGRRTTHIPRKTIIVSPAGYWPRWDGYLSMELLESKNGVHYFRYLHSSSIMHVQEAFEAARATHDLNAIASILARYPYHVEALLTFAEVFKFSGEHQSSADAIAKCLYALECAWHPLFSPMQGNCQLKYIHDMNKPFFQALFCHMNNMERRGCHRSALEVCKLLLSVDSDDPTGSMFCIDYFALRAQEFEWLEHFVEEYQSDSSLWLFPNFSYSLAVCRFYLERDATSKATEKSEKATANELMKQALLLHPLVFKKLVDKAPLKDQVWNQILSNSFFRSAQAGNPSLEHLVSIYVERNYIMWRLPELQGLLKEAALQVVESIKRDDSEARDWACLRKEAFSSEKNVYSHLLISDFSDVVPTLPPEEIRHFMVGPQIAHGLHDENIEANAEGIAQVPREVVGRNPLAVFFESLLPWVDYGVDSDGQPHDQHEGQ